MSKEEEKAKESKVPAKTYVMTLAQQYRYSFIIWLKDNEKIAEANVRKTKAEWDKIFKNEYLKSKTKKKGE